MRYRRQVRVDLLAAAHEEAAGDVRLSRRAISCSLVNRHNASGSSVEALCLLPFFTDPLIEESGTGVPPSSHA
jgi:hypothetical protein